MSEIPGTPRTHTKSKVSELRAVSKYLSPFIRLYGNKGWLSVRLLSQNALDCLAYKQEKFLSCGSGGWTAKIRVPAWSLIYKPPSSVFSRGRERERTSRSSSYEDTNSIMEAPVSDLITSQRPRLLKPSH